MEREEFKTMLFGALQEHLKIVVEHSRSAYDGSKVEVSIYFDDTIISEDHFYLD